MISLFVCDIDGCLSEPYQPVDLTRLVKLAARVKQGGNSEHPGLIPAFTLCSGRPFPYVECMAQVLGIQQPVLFESGGGLFDPVSASVSWSPNLTDDIRREIDEVAAWMLRECIPGSSMIFDYAKRTQAGVIGPDPDEIAAHVPLVEAFVEQNGLTLNVLPTYLSIDVVPDGITKDTGVEWLSKTLGVSLSNMAYIGDSIGDLGAMRSVGLAFAPENAMSAVKEEVDYITSARLQGVLDAIELCVERNRSGVESEPIK